MSEFLTPLNLRAVPGGWRFETAFRYKSSFANRIFESPYNEFTDLASIPKWVPRWIFDVANGPTREPAAVHDPLCKKEFKEYYGISQFQADVVLLEACILNGVPGWKIPLIAIPVMGYQFYKHKTDYWRKL